MRDNDLGGYLSSGGDIYSWQHEQVNCIIAHQIMSNTDFSTF